uniref:AP-3 complex subunit sigma-2 n=1 Tax=Dromaius novaehollandiae TaxID=8790 RepID=A0A8C4JH47_DRONO
MISAILVFNNHGKPRLVRFYQRLVRAGRGDAGAPAPGPAPWGWWGGAARCGVAAVAPRLGPGQGLRRPRFPGKGARSRGSRCAPVGVRGPVRAGPQAPLSPAPRPDPSDVPGRVPQAAPAAVPVAEGAVASPSHRERLAHGVPQALLAPEQRGRAGTRVLCAFPDGGPMGACLASLQAEEVQQQIIRETFHLVLKRDDHICNFLECGSLFGGSDYKLIYRHYATLYFVFCVDSSESELGILDLIQVHYILQEVVIGGMVLETNMNEIVAQAEAQSKLEKAEGGLSAAPSRAVSAVKNINLPEIPRNINIGDINIKVPNLSQFV